MKLLILHLFFQITLLTSEEEEYIKNENWLY